MPFTIIRVSRAAGGETEVIGEFADEAQAEAFAEDARACDSESDYLVEAPPHRSDAVSESKPE
jgi:hypothetical protein